MSYTVDTFDTLIANNNPAEDNKVWSEPLLRQFDIKYALGKGGQGSVFLAYEYRLQRDVAIKRLDNQPLNGTELIEAQTQAKIEHPNISKLFQVLQGDSSHPSSYLVMQYIQGQNALEWALAQRKSCQNKAQWHRYIRQIVTMTQDVCDGLQALHSAGIVHRDIKPANIMVTTGPANHIHPYIVDFGLAQHQEHEDEFISGSWPFMSPEQKRGEPLSASSDIFSLGMSLYQLLSAQLPQPDEDNLSLSAKVDNNAAIPLPVELVVIIKRCLSPDRQDRYPSALALRQELQRFLAGEPITSIDSTSYRFKKKLIKHRWAALLLVIFSLGATAQLAWLQHQKSQNQARERLVAQLHQTVQQAQYQSNLAYMAPPHDIRYLQNQHQHNLEQVMRQAQALGQSTQPFALYAQGRIAQQQGHFVKAKQRLQTAWQQGFKTVESAYVLVQVLNALYQQALSRLYIMPHGDLRQAQQAQLQQAFVQPIIGYLEFIQQQTDKQADSRANPAEKSYIQALLYYYKQDYNSAIKLLTEPQRFSPWYYQHYLLLAQSYVGEYQQPTKPSPAQAKQLISKAEQAFDKALTIAPSDPNNYIQKWQFYSTLVNNSQYGTGSALAPLDKADKLISDALKLNPIYLDTLVSQIKTQYQRMIYLFNQDEPWQTALATTQSLIEQALIHWPEHPKLLRMQAKVLSRQLVHSKQPRATKKAQYQAIEQLYQGLSQQQQLGFDDLIYYALHQKYWGDFIEDSQKAREKYQAAATLFEQAIASKPEYSGSYVNLALILLKLSETDSARQSLARLDSAIMHLNSALSKGYSEFISHYYLTLVRLQIANLIGSSDLAKGVTELKMALKAAAQAKQAKPNNYHAVSLEIKVLSQLIEHLWYLNKPQTDFAQQLVTLQLARLSDNAHKLPVLSNSCFILTTVLEKQIASGKLNEQWQFEHQNIIKLLNDKLTRQLADKPPSAELSAEQTLALSNLLYAHTLQAKAGQLPFTQLKPLMIRFSQSAKTADYYWTLGNYHRLEVRQHKTLQQQLDAQAKVIDLFQQAHQLEPKHIGYHFSLLTSHIQQLVLLEQLKNQAELDKTITAINALNQQLSNNTALNQWVNTLLEQQASGKLMHFLNRSKTQPPFAASIML